MYQMTKPLLGCAPVVPPTSVATNLRLHGFVSATRVHINDGAPRDTGLLSRCYPASSAELLIAGTSCKRPLISREMELLCEVTGYHGVLLRFDVDRGAKFDILPQESRIWLCDYLAWRRRDGDLWLIPSTIDGVFIRTSITGLDFEETPPFDSMSERHAGIIPAITTASFEGSL